MVAIDVVRMQPNSIITSPTNTRGQVDHHIRNNLALTILECKGVDDRQRLPIRLNQLWDYAFGPGPNETIYVLPSRPPGSTRAWNRPCGRPCCGGPFCRFCPRDKRSWAGLEAWNARLALVDQLQPWFAHWSWCVPCTDLAAALGVEASLRPVGGTTSLQWDDANLEQLLPTATRLCHFFGIVDTVSPYSEAVRRVRDQQLEHAALDDSRELGTEETELLIVLQPMD